MITDTPTTVFVWISFNLFVLAMLAIDLYFFHRDAHIVKRKEAVIWSAVWICLALLFCLGINYTLGSEPALSFLTGYLIEKALSIDNLFVFMVIFSYFAVPKQYLHTVLFWGVLGALVMRAIFIFSGIVLIQYFHWITYLLGALLVFTGIRLALGKESEIDPEKNPVLNLFRKVVPITSNFEGNKFFVKRGLTYWATPLFAVLIVVETTDILFAIDSVPAILAITQDPFIVYTSNVFAILGLRALYFALSGYMETVKYLHYGLALLLIFIGLKMLLADFITIPIPVALGVIFVILAGSICISLWSKKL